uniref:Uncharacterized protein n=1 Tax=Phytophthora ramorum TaxID=164328 RepID=H3GHY9_PHYRM
MAFQQHLSELFESLVVLDDASVASQWTSAIRNAFYGSHAATRGSNRFLELEAKLAQTFEGFSVVNQGEFWRFAVLVVLQLAQETAPVEETEHAGADSATAKKGKKRKKKKAQPNAPLAFMVVNALRKLTEGGHRDQQRWNCHIQGQKNDILREFCVAGLQDPELVDQKLVVEIVDLFAITDIDPQTVQGAAQCLLASKKYTALIKLLTIFSSVDWSFVSTIKAMAKCKDWSAAELLAKTFGGPDNKDLGKVLVDEAIAIQDVKRVRPAGFGGMSDTSSI